MTRYSKDGIYNTLFQGGDLWDIIPRRRSMRYYSKDGFMKHYFEEEIYETLFQEEDLWDVILKTGYLRYYYSKDGIFETFSKDGICGTLFKDGNKWGNIPRRSLWDIIDSDSLFIPILGGMNIGLFETVYTVGQVP